MKVLISGSHGLVGGALVKSLTTNGHECIRLVRHGRTVGAPEVEWHPEKGLIDKEQLEGIEAVVHLAGENIAEGRWTSEKKRAILESRVNGTVRQSSTTSQLIFPIPTLVAFISEIMTLLPGDIIATGTPSGIGPLAAGDRVTIRVEGVGELTNPVGQAIRLRK